MKVYPFKVRESEKNPSVLTKKPAIDLSYIFEMTMNDTDIILETVETFLQTAPKILDNMQDYCEHREWEKLGKEAHKIKPNLIYMGMNEAHGLITDIEHQAKNDDTNGIEDQLEKFLMICKQAFEELPKKVNELES